MNLVVTLHITRMNPSQTNMSKEDSSHLKQTIWLHSHNNSHHLRKAVKRTPSSMDQGHNRERSAQGHPSESTDDMPQGPAPTAPTTQAGGPPQAPPVTNPNRDCQDPPEHNGTTRGSTKATANGKAPGATKSKKKASEPHPGTVASTDPATQPSDSSKNTIICSGCGESGH